MEEDTLFSCESVNVEYKAAVPANSDKYMKTVVAYANGQGGRIVFGVDDRTLQVIGMDTDSMLKELILEGQNRYYDCEICESLTATPEDIALLCAKTKETAFKNTLTEGEKRKNKDVTTNVLLSWGVLAERDGAVFPTNAYALLTGQARFQPVIQCAVFKGKDRAYFVDRREFEGSIQEQMEAAFQYVLEKINRGMRIHGMYRQDVYELPVDSVREMIANSVAHRSYLEPEFIDFDGDFRVNMYRRQTDEIVDSSVTTQTTQMKGFHFTKEDKEILSLVHRQPGLTQKELAMELGWTQDRVKYYLNKMKKLQVIQRVGSSHNGHWEVLIEKNF